MPRDWKNDDSVAQKNKSSKKASSPREDGRNDHAPVGREPVSLQLKKPFVSVRIFFWTALIVAILLAAPSLYRRLSVEWTHRTVAMVVDYRDIATLSAQASLAPQEVYEDLHKRGVWAVTVSELTGKDLAAGMLPLSYASLSSFDPSYKKGVDLPATRGALLVDSAEPLLPKIMEFLRIRMPGTLKHVAGKQTLIVLPGNYDELNDAGILPDFIALTFAEAAHARVLYRPYPAAGVDGEHSAATLDWLKKHYPTVSCILPAGQMVAGYPQLAPIVKTLRENDLPVAQAEFVRQIGISSLFHSMRPDIIPLHSLVREELISRRLSRDQIVERMVRAVHERSIRLLLVRPYDLYSVGKLPFFLEDLQKIHDSLSTKGYTFGWPRTMPMFGASLLSATALSLVFITMLWSYARRYTANRNRSLSKADLLLFVALTVLLGGMIWKIGSVSRLLGGFAAALVATEATIWALDKYRKPFDGLIAGLLIVLGGGLVIAAHYGTTMAMLRLAPFSGVKLTLLLPPLLVLASDLKLRVHPESLADIMRRPPLWGELMLVGVLVLGALILTVRSDNVAFVPGWEIRFRDMLERLLWVRPRTKEFLFGYPCLILYYSLVRGEVAPHYREVLRIGATLAYASAVNTFCHFHTLLPLTVVRVVNGWWLGILVGFVLLVLIDYIGGPIWRRGGRELFR